MLRMMPEPNVPPTTTSNTFASRSGPGHITLESLLDSPGLTPPSPLSESLNDPCLIENGATHVRNQNNLVQTAQSGTDGTTARIIAIDEKQRLAFLRDVCVELLCILRSQDINGYFLSSVQALGVAKSHNRVGLLDIEKRVFANSYQSFSDFQSDVTTLFSGAMAHHADGTHVYAEAQRLYSLSSDWFASISPDHLQILNIKPQKGLSTEPVTCAINAVTMDKLPLRSNTPPPLAAEAYLGILNPDNHGIVSRTERVRSIGEEVGQLRSGSYLLPNGGYREDRRNKVIPYTYLDYGPYYSFAPRFDSGASHCSPEANQLILSTSWLPARTAFLTVKQRSSGDVRPDSCDTDEVTRAVQSEAVIAALETGDHQLAVSLAVMEMENQATAKLSAELDQILPDPGVDEDCVFGLCLANALTRNLLESDGLNREESQLAPGDSEAPSTPDVATCDLDQREPRNECTEPDPLQYELMGSANDLRALYCAQYRRLGDTSQNGTTLHPSSSETTIAHRLVGRLIKLTKHAKPRDLVHPYTVRRAMGMKPDLYPLPDSVDLNLESDETSTQTTVTSTR